MTLRIHDLSDDDRPREKALRHGISSLTDTELLTICIGSGLPGLSALDMARGMLNVAGGKLSGIRTQSIHSMIKNNPGVGPAKAVSIAAAFELGVRCRDESRDEKVQVRSSRDIYDYMRYRVEALPNEQFWVITLSRANHITGEFRVSDGGTSSTVVDVKLLMKQVVDRIADGIILVHNHPSGTMKPSAQDRDLTRRIKGACELFGVRLLDHVIIGPDAYFSFQDEGIL